MNWTVMFFDMVVFGVYGYVGALAGLTVDKWNFWVCLLCLILIQNRHQIEVD